MLDARASGRFLCKHAFGRRECGAAARFDVGARSATVSTATLVDYFWARFNRAGGREASYAVLQIDGRAAPTTTANPVRVRAPTLLVWGDEDRMVPLAHGKRLQRAIAGARLRVVPACGHMPHIERPDELLRVVSSFLDAPPVALAETPTPSRRAHALGR